MTNQNTKLYSIVDLFAGAGGLSYGFLQTGRFAVKAAFEMNTDAQNTYKRNHGDQVAVYSDVEDALSEETKERLGQVDVVIGGPPCQGFSNANRQKNHAISQNNSLVKKYVQAVLHLEPMAFIMENVSMLQSDIHRFYVDKNDQSIISQYNIATALAEIQLLDAEFWFDGAAMIAESKAKISKYLWHERDYLVLNVVYKARNNKEKLKKALAKHKKRLLALADKLIECRDDSDHIIHKNNLAGDVIKQYYTNRHTDKKATALCGVIQTVIMLQRMLSKAMEIHNNDIVVDKYCQECGLTAHVTSMAISEYIESILGADDNGYCITKGVLSAASFGAPQKRMRYVVMGVKKAIAQNIDLPIGTYDESNFRTVEDAIKDIESIPAETKIEKGNTGVKHLRKSVRNGTLEQLLRDSDILYNHVSTETTPEALERFKAIKQGDNFHSLPPELKTTYSDTERTQNTIYLRLRYDEPSGTVLNVRKSMWIHPTLHRALSIREAARLQTFPDSFVFFGTKDSQYQQIGNAVPPILARGLAVHLCNYLDAGCKVSSHQVRINTVRFEAKRRPVIKIR